MHRQVFLIGLVLCLWTFTLSACSRDTTPTTAPPTSDTLQSTLSALQAENTRLKTQIAVLQSTPTIPPTRTAPPTAASPTSPQPTVLPTLTSTVAAL
jgi:hypothetical protein